MLDGYIPLLITLILLVVALMGAYSILPTIAASRQRPKKRISFKIKDIVGSLADENSPSVKDSSYLRPYESGEVARGEIGSFVTVQYYVVLLLFIIFDVDMVLLLPWAFNFKNLGLVPFIETLVFMAMPLFAVYYAFKEGYMRWMK